MAARPPLPYDFLPSVPSFQLTSDDVADGQMLTDSQVYNGFGMTGKNISPALSWSGFPDQTAGFAVTCYDPDAPTGSGFWHWLVIDIPASVTSLAAGAGAGNLSLPYGTADFGGAAPPPGEEHRYVFAVHAVDTAKLGIDGNVSAAVAGFNLRFHTLARALLIPVFEH
jgi:hypothetical protein